MNKRSLTLFFALGIFLLATSTYSQNCSKTRFCTQESYGDFDYKSQTRSAMLSPGDTVRTNVVVYDDQTTRILVCGDSKLGNIKFKIFETKNENKKYVKRIDVKEEEVEEVMKDEKGNPKKDAFGDVMKDYKKITRNDTIWGIKANSREVEVYDSQNNPTGKNYWQKKETMAKRLVVEAILPEGDDDVVGCVSVYVGFKIESVKDGFK